MSNITTSIMTSINVGGLEHFEIYAVCCWKDLLHLKTLYPATSAKVFRHLFMPI